MTPTPELRCLPCAARGKKLGCRRCAALTAAADPYARFRRAARVLREHDERTVPAPDLRRLGVLA